MNRFLFPLMGLAVGLSAAARAEALPWNDAGGPYCREYSADIHIDGGPERAHGVACLQPDGTWKIQPEQEYEQAEAAAPPPPTVEYVAVPVYAPLPYYSLHAGHGHWRHRHWPHHSHHRWHRHRHHGSYVGFGFSF